MWPLLRTAFCLALLAPVAAADGRAQASDPTALRAIDSSRLDTRRIVEEAAGNAAKSADPDAARVGRFYGSCIDSTRANRERGAPLREPLARIAAIRTPGDLAERLGALGREGVDAGVPTFGYSDFAQSDTMRLHFYQGGIGLPDRDFYLRGDSVFAAARKAYRGHMTRMFGLLGLNPTAAGSAAARAWRIELALAKAALPAEDATQWSRLHHPAARADLDTLAPNFEWTRYFQGLGVPGIPRVNVAIPRQLRALDSLAVTVPVETWRDYLRWRLASAAAPYLDRRFEREALELRRITRGETELKPRWQRCLYATDELIGEALGAAYVRGAFSLEAKARAQAMIANVKAVMQTRIQRLGWMSPTTKQAALAKLESDPHTSIRWRVNGAVGHLPAFAEAFDCPATAPMVRPADGRMRIW